MDQKIKTEPKDIAREYKNGRDFKDGIGDRGIYEQSKMNERFFVGDQWYGVQCGNSRPLARRNLIKRIGEYKMSCVGSAPISVNYSADGVPNTVDLKDDMNAVRTGMMNGDVPPEEPRAAEISVITAALSDYFQTTAERLKFENKKDQLLRNAYISGTAICHTYWDDRVETGLYADEERKLPIKGDIAFEVLDVENVNFGDPNNDDVQSQPYIIISQRRSVDDVIREAKHNRASAESISMINPDDGSQYNSGDRGDTEPDNSQRVTVFTKFYKIYDDSADQYKIMAVRTTERATVRKPWELGLKNYPIAKFCWERRRSSAYGDSEITYLIPNQIAINRMLTASVWATMAVGMPKMIVNGDVVTGDVSNDPGEVIKVYGASEDVAGAIRYAVPPVFNAGYQNIIGNMSDNTLSDSGANDAALGNLRPDNAAAIVQTREAALAPMQIYQNRFYDFIEDIARIWADFWINKYGNRALKITDKTGTWYLPFEASRYQNLILSAKIDVGASTVYSESVVISTLGNLLTAGLITFDEYLERIPKGMIPDVTGLRESRKIQQQDQGGELTDDQLLQQFAQQYPEQYAKYQQLPPDQQQAVLQQIRAQMQPSGQTEQQTGTQAPGYVNNPVQGSGEAV